MTPLETAAAYAELGWAILPLCGVAHPCPTPGKIPVDLATGRHLAGWQQRGIPTVAEIARWLEAPLAPRANLGCLTGQISGVVALDVDGPGGEALLARYAGGDLPATWEYRTGGGRRLIYRYEEGMRSLKLSGDGQHEGLEVLSDGRQMVIPPSRHKSGPDYAWVPGRDPWTFGDVAPCPAWIRRLAGQPARRGATDWAALAGTPTSPGGRHPTLVQLAAHMAAHREDPRFITAMLTAWNEARCRPPKPAEEVARIVAWAVAREQAARRGTSRDAYQLARDLGCSVEAARALIGGQAS